MYTLEKVDHIIYYKTNILTIFISFNNIGVDKSVSESITDDNNIVRGTFIIIIATWTMIYNSIYHSCV